MTDTTSSYRSATDLPDPAREALSGLLLCLADNKRLLGIRYSDWLLGAPSVEAGISCSAMAQDEWGHARIVYAVLKEFGLDPDHLEHERDADAYHSSELLDHDVASWPDLIALNLLLDTAISVQFEGLLESRFEPIHYKVRKLLDEERFHFEHARGWTLRLGETDAGRQALHDAFAAVWPAIAAWFGPDDDPAMRALAADGLVARDAAGTRARWLERVGPVVSAAGLDLAEPRGREWTAAIAPDWSDWSPERRRTAGGGPDEDTLARARGDRNRRLVSE